MTLIVRKIILTKTKITLPHYRVSPKNIKSNFHPNKRPLNRITKYRLMATISTNDIKINVHELANLPKSEISNLCARPRKDFTTIMDTVSPIVEDVKNRGDAAVKEYTKKFDEIDLDWICKNIYDIDVPEIPDGLKKAFNLAFDNIRQFHEKQKTSELVVETMHGVRCHRISRPIESVGLYVPGGTAILPSSALMLATPASLAGCKTIVLATPPGPDGDISPEVLYCADMAGATHILKAGGAQAIAAMAWGTETCPKVDKILGPGNQFVTAAKMLLQNSEALVSMDMPAGPSEVLVIADKKANPEHTACDLLSQAEHGEDSQAILVALPGVNIDKIQEAIQNVLQKLPRAEITRKALSHSKIIKAKDIDEAMAFSNLYAPEHLIVNIEDAESTLSQIKHAGSVFLGRYTPESVGDYASGTNHTLPTYGYAKMYSGVSLDSFVKNITVQKLTEDGLKNLGPTVMCMADVEGLEAHRLAVASRLNHFTE